MKLIDLYAEASKDVTLITINKDDFNSEGNIELDIWGYHGQSALIDMTEAEQVEANINSFEIISHNFIVLKFRVKQHLVKIKNLVIKFAGVDYGGGANVENLQIISNHSEQIINPVIARNISVVMQPDENEQVIRSLLKSIEIIPGCGRDALKDAQATKSLSQMKETLPNVKWIAPVAAWFADSLDIAKCKILPCSKNNTDYFESINDIDMVRFLDKPKASDLKVIFYPLLIVSVSDQPWRGHITGKTEDIEAFYLKYYKPFILHYAYLVKDKIDAFIIGSELEGLTKIHTANNKFPFVQKLVELTSDLKAILGSEVKLTYAANWTEYHTSDGVLRPLDELWSAPNIDFIGINAYFPLTHSIKSRITLEEIKAGWRSGEGWDYWLSTDRQQHSFNGEEWNQWKNLQYWWENEHWVWNKELQQSIKSPWQPRMKPIWFTEVGFPSIDKATNTPNVFFNPKSREGGMPVFSNGKPDFAIARLGLRATFFGKILLL